MADPYLTDDPPARVHVEHAERELHQAVTSAFRQYLTAVEQAVLDRRTNAHLTNAHLTADSAPDPDLWPPQSVWTRLVDSVLLPVWERLWRRAFARFLSRPQRTQLRDRDFVTEHLDDARERLTGAAWPHEVYEAVRAEIRQAHQDRETLAQIRDRVRRVLGPDQWRTRAATVARTETLAALNGGAWRAGLARQEVFGQRLFKQWIATDDQRTRPAHQLANGELVAVDEPFVVGGEHLRFPHDPRGSAANSVNCRCVLNWLDTDEATAAAAQVLDQHTTDNEEGRSVDLTADDQHEHDDGSRNATENEAATAASTSSRSWYERIAAAVPAEPPAAWFTDPELTGPTKIRVTDEGRVYGHICDWHTEHASLPGITAARFRGESYHRFHRHPVRTREGARIKTGPLATGGHISTDDSVGLTAAQMHYDQPEFVAADVVVGEDQHGIWCSGALRPGVSPFQVMLLDRYSISGDWRYGELVAACSVSVPGFHLDHDENAVALAADAGPHRPRLAEPQPRARFDDDYLCALVAAGVVTDRPREHAPLDGWKLFRQFQAAAAADRRIQAARRRLHAPRVQAAATRVHRTN